MVVRFSLILVLILASFSVQANKVWRPKLKPKSEKLTDMGVSFGLNKERKRLYNIGYSYLVGSNGFSKSRTLAKTYFLHAAFIGDEPSAFILGEMYYEEGDLTRAVYWFTGAQNKGIYQAQVRLKRDLVGVPYVDITQSIDGSKYSGENVNLLDIPVISKNLLIKKVKKTNKTNKTNKTAIAKKKTSINKKMSSSGDNKNTKKELATISKGLEVFTLFTGEETNLISFVNIEPKIYAKEFHQALQDKENGNYQEAYKIFRFYAVQGDKESQFNMAQFFRLGWGVERDLEKASYWYGRAAVQLHPEAMLSYAISIYEQLDQIDVDRNVSEYLVYSWAAKAYENGNDKAKEFINIYLKENNNEGETK